MRRYQVIRSYDGYVMGETIADSEWFAIVAIAAECPAKGILSDVGGPEQMARLWLDNGMVRTEIVSEGQP